MDGVRIALLVWCLMKKLVSSLLLVLVATSIGSACDWYPGKLIAERRAARSAQAAPRVSACVSAPPVQFTFAIAPRSGGAAVVNPVRTSLSRWAAPSTCTGPNCPK